MNTLVLPFVIWANISIISNFSPTAAKVSFPETVDMVRSLTPPKTVLPNPQTSYPNFEQRSTTSAPSELQVAVSMPSLAPTPSPPMNNLDAMDPSPITIPFESPCNYGLGGQKGLQTRLHHSTTSTLRLLPTSKMTRKCPPQQRPYLVSLLHG